MEFGPLPVGYKGSVCGSLTVSPLSSLFSFALSLSAKTLSQPTQSVGRTGPFLCYTFFILSCLDCHSQSHFFSFLSLFLHLFK